MSDFVCLNCKDDNVPHKARGLCNTCYQRFARSRRRRSVHRDWKLPKLDREKLAYLSGSIDSGARIYFVRGSESPKGFFRGPVVWIYYHARNRAHCDAIRDLIDCGGIVARKKKGKIIGFVLQVRARIHVLSVLERLYPYLISLRTEADKAIRFLRSYPYRGAGDWTRTRAKYPGQERRATA